VTEERRQQCTLMNTHLTGSDLTLKMTTVVKVMMMMSVMLKRFIQSTKLCIMCQTQLISH